ncbi:MAG: insulinase family protein [Bacteroidia bacterium]|nr:insulinase family protein [Bacteroidia bacterium]NND25246.1 insulinase family protein [Flavobacteriaceae bacterium]MBT8277490.1 insulinase family protein [Bacteroidia bacterium]NNK61405.1 insulinase family protein [Flavobacteriaceae bacterium]NNL32798.1 insulinase family protein [Flavobacteriaceae bacterium]
MKNLFYSLATFVFVVLAANAQEVKFEEFDLDNGLHVILHQDNTAPIVTVGVMYDVGGKDLGDNGNPERTGFAHFFEHLLFEGTENIDRGKWFDIVASNGGSNNANTSLDRTYYYEVFPSNNLELGLWMESERMLHPVIDVVGVETQNEVVKEEKRSSYDNRAYAQILFAINDNLFKKHPYKNKNIGEMEHLDAATLDEFKAYFNKYYVPNNAVLVVTGDFDPAKCKELIKTYFKDIPKGTVYERNFPKEEPITETIKAKYYDANIQIPAILAAYRTPGFAERDAYVLNMISAYLSDGKSSKLYKKLVDDQKQALAVQAVNIAQRDYGVYAMFALPLGDVSLSVLLSEIDEEITKMQNELISERDYQKLQNKFENRFVNSNAGVQGIAGSLATYYMLHGDVNLINDQIKIYRSITREEIQSVVKKYLNPNQRVELEYLPKPSDK